MALFNKFPYTHQLESKDCGPSCLQLICKFYGQFFELEFLREICGIKKAGVSVYDLIKAAEKLNLRSSAFKLSFWKFRNQVPLPCIVHWKGHHFVVVYKITDKHIYVSDPQEGLKRYNLTEFASAWLANVEPEPGKKTKKGICIAIEPTNKFNSVGSTIKSNSSTLDVAKFMWDYMKLDKRSIFKVFLLTLVVTVISVFFPIITQNIIDVGIPTKDYDFITLLMVSSLVLTFSNSLSLWIKQLMSTHFGAKIKLSMQADYISKMFKLPLNFFETRLMGDIIQRNNDYDRLEAFIMSTGFEFVLAFFQLIIFGIILAYYNFTIFIVFLASSLIYIMWILFFWSIRKKMDIRYFGNISKNQSEWIEMLSNMSDIKSYNYGNFKRWQWEKIQIKLFKTRIKMLNADQMQNMGSSLINSIKKLLLIYIGAMFVSKGQMTMGMLIAIQYILGQLVTPTESLIQFIVNIQLANISYMRVFEILSKKSEDELMPKVDNPKLIDFDNDIILDHLYYKYGANDDYVLKNINCILPRGKLIAIVGESGCGKSTLLKLISGLYMPCNGKIKIGSLNLSSIPVNEWRSRIGVLTQDSQLLNESILDNIVFGRDFNAEEVKKVTMMANVLKDIESRPMGFETYISENGKGVSEGQKQRLLLARALYGSPQFLFLDELTSSLDSNNEFSVISSIKQLSKHPTTLLVAHRISSVKAADYIIVIKDGMIKETGSYSNLFKKGTYFYELFKNQEFAQQYTNIEQKSQSKNTSKEALKELILQMNMYKEMKRNE